MREQLGLNGAWQFRIDRKDEGEREGWYAKSLTETRTVEVPHIWQREEDYVHYCGTAWYEKEFEAFTLSPGQKAFLGFGAVDFQARVWLNGEFVGEHEGGFTPFEFDVSAQVRPEGVNRLTVRVFDPQDNAEIPIGKQGSWYTRISGIWQEVLLERRPDCFIRQVHVIPDIDGGLARTRVMLSGDLPQGAELSFEVAGHLHPKPLVTESRADVDSGEVQHDIPVPGAQLWSPQEPHLYDLKVQLRDAEGAVLDTFGTYFGMRTIEFADGQLLLNGQPLFVRGALDQAFYPDTIYTAPSDEWIRMEIQRAKDMGFNLLRKHIKVEIPRYLYWADRMGMLIWAEPPNVVKWSEQSRRRFSDELRAMIDRDFNHPSILMWSLYNEEWGLEWDLANDKAKQEHVIAMYRDIKSMDPTRLICDNSGWIHVKTDINDYHRYFVLPEQSEEWKSDLDDYMAGHPEQNYVQGYAPQGEPIIISEFGVWGLPSVEKLLAFYGGEPSWFANLGDDTHREDFKKPLTAYENFEKYQLQRIFGNLENLSMYSQRRMYRAVKSLIEEMRKRPQINGYVVTEFTDIEWETNGWMDYTRNLKWGMEHAADFNGGLVVMADGVKRNLWSGESQSWDILISNHDQRSLSGEVRWEIPGTGLSGSIPLDEGNRTFAALEGAISFEAPQVAGAGFYELKLSIILDQQVAAANVEELTISPRRAAEDVLVCAYGMEPEFGSRLADSGIRLTEELHLAEAVVTSVLDERVLDYYRRGGHVVFLAEDGDQLAEKGQFTFRELVRGESWDRTSSFNYVDPEYFTGVPLHHEMGWEMEGLYPDYIVPFSNYNKLGGTIGRVVYMFGNEGITETSEIVSGYFQGWIGQAGGSLLEQKSAQGSLILTTWKLKQHYGIHPIATQVLQALILKCRKL